MSAPVVLVVLDGFGLGEPGAGGASDTVGLLEALVRNDARDAVFACLYDPPAAEAAYNRANGTDPTWVSSRGPKMYSTYMLKKMWTRPPCRKVADRGVHQRSAANTRSRPVIPMRISALPEGESRSMYPLPEKIARGSSSNEMT